MTFIERVVVFFVFLLPLPAVASNGDDIDKQYKYNNIQIHGIDFKYINAIPTSVYKLYETMSPGTDSNSPEIFDKTQNYINKLIETETWLIKNYYFHDEINSSQISKKTS